MILKFPPTRWVSGPLKYNANARVNLFGIRLRRSIARPAAVFAQELYEWSVRAAIFAAVAILAAVAVAVTGQGMIAPVGLLAAYAAAELPWVRGPGMRWLELRGHAVTRMAVIHYYPDTVDDWDKWRRSHAESMQRFYPAFRDMTPDEIEVRLFKLEPWAGRWISKGWVRKRMMKVEASKGV